MLTLTEINSEIKSIEGLSWDEIKDMKKGEYSRLQKRLDLLRTLKSYLETSPAQEFIDSELNRLETLINAKMIEFDPDKYEKLTKKEVTKLKKDHEKMYNIPHFRSQVRALRILQK